LTCVNGSRRQRRSRSREDAKLKRLYDANESGIADLADPMLKDRVAELKAARNQGRADTERAEGALERLGPSITPQSLKTFARTARTRMRTESGGYRRDRLRALAQRVEVDAKEVRIMGSKSVLLRTLVAASSAKTAPFGGDSVFRSGAPREIRTLGPVGVLQSLGSEGRRKAVGRPERRLTRLCKSGYSGN
jgi:hypothetical protein